MSDFSSIELFIDGMIFGRQRFGGISRVWEEFLQRLPEYGVGIKLLIPFRQANHSLRRLLQQKEKYDLIRDYLYWPKRFFERVPVRSKALGSVYVDDTVDIFHSTYLSTVYDRKIKKVVTIYDMIPELFQDIYRSKWNSWTIDIKSKVLENADRIVAISQNTKCDILRIYPWIPEERVSVIYCGPSESAYDINITLDTISEKHSISLSPEEYFMFVGQRSGYKNFQIILDLFESSTAYRDMLFLCVGGEDDRRLSSLLAKKGLSNNFALLSYVQDNELAVLYRNALALILPSRYEGFGFPIVEAMANECPVICSNSSCFPEIAGDAAFFFDPDSVESLQEAIAGLLRCDRNVIIERGLRNVTRFSWDESTKALMNLYMDLA